MPGDVVYSSDINKNVYEGKNIGKKMYGMTIAQKRKQTRVGNNPYITAL